MGFLGRLNQAGRTILDGANPRDRVLEPSYFYGGAQVVAFNLYQADVTTLPITDTVYARNAEADATQASILVRVGGFYSVSCVADMEIAAGARVNVRLFMFVNGVEECNCDSGFVRGNAAHFRNSCKLFHSLYLNPNSLITFAHQKGSLSTNSANISCVDTSYTIVPITYGST